MSEETTAEQLRKETLEVLEQQANNLFDRVMTEDIEPAKREGDFSVTIDSKKYPELNHVARRRIFIEILKNKVNGFKVEQTSDRGTGYFTISWIE